MGKQEADIYRQGSHCFGRSRPFRCVEAVRDGQSGDMNKAEMIGRNAVARSGEPLRLIKTAKEREYADPSVS